jgi:colanic acid biosynthesis glycosyl transferase WcaI
MTDPPVVGNVALLVARRFRVPLVVVSQDVFPEVAVQLKRLENRAVVQALRLAVRSYLRGASCIVAIGETMRVRLIEKGGRADRVRVIPNWVDTHKLTPAPRKNEWSRERGLDDRFVVMHSGNLGHAQNLDALVRAATFMRDVGDVTIAIIGQGARRDSLVRLAELLEVQETVRFWDYQPRDLLPYSLATADVHVVGLARGLAGYVVPSRVYGILAAARPIIAAVDDESETAALVRKAECGVVVSPGRPELLAQAIRAARDSRLDLAAMGARGRSYVIDHADRAGAVTQYRAVFDDVLRAAA